ncbi:MAG TPA: DUF2079 domain-containing protein, partial [bacterium]|nr:DUF2079 domain-containing protein [bacterium]
MLPLALLICLTVIGAWLISTGTPRFPVLPPVSPLIHLQSTWLLWAALLVWAGQRRGRLWAIGPVALAVLGGAAVFSWPLFPQGQVLFQLRTSEADLLAGLAAAGLLAAGTWVLLKNLPHPDDARTPALLLLTAGIVAALALALALRRHATFNSNAYDLGIFTQLFFNLTHGNGLATSIRGEANLLADHAAPTWWLFAPVALLPFPDAGTLIVLQWLIVVSAAWPLWLLARRWLRTAKAAAGVVLAFALYPPLHWFLLFDVHEVCLAIPLTLWLVWAWVSRAPALRFWSLALFLIGVKEELGIVAGTLGLVLAFLFGDRR